VDAVDYLLKPFGLDDFRRAAEKVKKQFELEARSYQQTIPATPALSSEPDNDDTLFLKTEHRMVRISISGIKYIEGMSEYLKIHLEDQKPVVVLYSMKKLEERLPSYFMRIHRTYIINLKKIQEVNKNRVILDAQTYLPIGDLYRDQFTDYLQQRFLGK
jgi:DNA-binding LytR/AlgR family response regulator